MGTIEERLDRLESRAEIEALAARYAVAVDSRDLDGLVALFVRDVDCGRLGRGREALKSSFQAITTRFYRSVHLLGGQAVDFDERDLAHGTVYCRAEHEDGPHWVVEALCYFDDYAREDGVWRFVRRRAHHWYAADWNAKPGDGGFHNWPIRSSVDGARARLPSTFGTWRPFWDSVEPERVAALTDTP